MSITLFLWQATQSQVDLFQISFIHFTKVSIKVEEEKGRYYKPNLINKKIGKLAYINNNYGMICDQSNHFGKKKKNHKCIKTLSQHKRGKICSVSLSLLLTFSFYMPEFIFVCLILAF